MNDGLLEVDEIVQSNDASLISPRVHIDPAHVAKIQPEEKKLAAAQEDSTGVEAALIQEVWFYVRPSERCPGEGAIAQESVDLARELK